MKIFDLDPQAQASTYRSQGYLHVPSGVSAEFLDYATEFVRGSGALDVLEGEAIQGAKTQYVFEFPDDLDWEADLLDVVAAMSGLRRDRLTLSERHIKAYLPDADPLPTAHKDRFASGIAIGLTLAVGPGSHVVVYPDTDRSVNPHLTAGLRDALAPEEQPEVTLQGGREVEIHDAPGDVMAFPGASVWHLRRNAASTVLLYLKFNDFDSDPLGEDPSTLRRSEQTRQRAGDPEALSASVPVLARRFDSVGRETGRGRDRVTWHVNVWEGERRQAKPVPAAYAALVESVESADGSATVAELAERGAAGLQGPALVEAVRVLATRGALDLLPAGGRS